VPVVFYATPYLASVECSGVVKREGEKLCERPTRDRTVRKLKPTRIR